VQNNDFTKVVKGDHMFNSDENIQYLTPREISEDPRFCFTLPMIRYYLLHSHKNGLKKAVRKIGKKVLIRLDLFIEWIETHQQ